MKLLFDNHRQALKVRIVLWVVYVAGVAALYAGWNIFQTFGLSPGDGGVLRPFGERLAFGAFVALLGVGLIAGMMTFARLYAVKLSREDERINIETLTILGIGRKRHSFDIAKVGAAAYHHGRMSRGVVTGGGSKLFQHIDAPWITLRTAGQRLPFILDLQAEVIKIGPLSVLTEGAVSKWRKDRG
jgi:hypothetical protein